MEKAPHDGWHGYAPTAPLVVALAGGRIDSPLSNDLRFELNIYEIPTGFWLLIIDWSNESQMDSDHATLDAAKQHAAEVLHDHALNWEPWIRPSED